jgi:hypothetical protein
MTKGSDVSEGNAPLQIPLPGIRDRAVQFQHDWPGLFLRGDTALVVAWAIRELECRLSDTADDRVSVALNKLSPIAELIEKNVRV